MSKRFLNFIKGGANAIPSDYILALAGVIGVMAAIIAGMVT